VFVFENPLCVPGMRSQEKLPSMQNWLWDVDLEEWRVICLSSAASEYINCATGNLGWADAPLASLQPSAADAKWSRKLAARRGW